MAVKKGTLSINSENIFPIIKKWVYSDHDIFVRELVSNGCDAITKLKKLDMMGEYQLPDDYKPAIKVEVNPEEKTLKFTDNGLGMTADEVEEYITQIAFSGATDFLEKYKDKSNDDQIIAHFDYSCKPSWLLALTNDTKKKPSMLHAQRAKSDLMFIIVYYIKYNRHGCRQIVWILALLRFLHEYRCDRRNSCQSEYSCKPISVEI